MNPQSQTQIDDFRNLKPYFDLVFENMTALSKYSFTKDFQPLTDALRELVINAPSYIQIEWEVESKETKKTETKQLDAEEILDLIEIEYGKLFGPEFYINGQIRGVMSKEVSEKYQKVKDNYLIFTRKLRIKISSSFTASGLLPKAVQRRIRKINKNLSGDEPEDE